MWGSAETEGLVRRDCRDQAVFAFGVDATSVVLERDAGGLARRGGEEGFLCIPDSTLLMSQ